MRPTPLGQVVAAETSQALSGEAPATSSSDRQDVKRKRYENKQERLRNRFIRASQRGFQGLSRERHGKWSGPFSFLQLADPQIGMVEGFQKGKTGGWDKELTLCRSAVRHINRLRPAFAIICGDLIDAWPEGEPACKPADIEKRERQIVDFKEIFAEIDEEIPLVCVCGNHDVGNRPNSKTIAAYSREFGDDYFSFWVRGVKCIVLNSGLFKDPSEAMKEREDQIKWLHSELEDAQGAQHIVVFSHIPPFVFEGDEPEEYFNFPRKDRDLLLDACGRAGVRHMFCGHYHRNATGVHENIEVVTTGAVGTQLLDKTGASQEMRLGLNGIDFTRHECNEEHSGLRVVNVLQDHINHEWRTFAELRLEEEGQEAVNGVSEGPLPGPASKQAKRDSAL